MEVIDSVVKYVILRNIQQNFKGSFGSATVVLVNKITLFGTLVQITLVCVISDSVSRFNHPFVCNLYCRKDSTGIPHILEHSVLCGSRKYPLKEPFVELLKGSLHTFLNAFTYPDRTCYPVASTNSKVKTGLTVKWNWEF